MRSVLEAMENDPNYSPNFESIEDSAKDLINYSSFLAAYVRGGIDGQLPDRDFLNRRKKTTDGGVKIYNSLGQEQFVIPPANVTYLNANS